jgi:hypothetical protein
MVDAGTERQGKGGEKNTEGHNYSFCHVVSLSLVPEMESRLGGVVFSVLVTGPKGRGFEPCQGDGFLRVIKIRSTPSL